MGDAASRGGARPAPGVAGGRSGDGRVEAEVDRVEEVLVAERPRLVGLAYRITGSRLDAEDIVQEAWERAHRSDAQAVERPAAWLTTVVARLALDHLKAAQRRRETYVGPWLPEPVVTGPGDPVPARPTPAGDPGAAADPAELAELAESLTFGFLRLLEALAPVERVVFVLAEVFGVPFPEIAAAVDRSPDACRQIASRARARVRDDGRRHQAPHDAPKVADDLVSALVLGDTDRVLSLLAPDVVLVSDGGAARHAARRPVVGPHRVARLACNIVRRGLDAGRGAALSAERCELNGEPASLTLVDGEVVLATVFAVDGGRVRRIWSVLNPDKLAALRLDGPIE
jgi:RNA polymerase sigma-70 factor, ECF subfamily